MELFKIIKKTFDKILKDSNDASKEMVKKEAERTDNALLTKTSIGDYFITEDISIEPSPVIDLDFIEWNILRHVFTKGVAAKVNGSLAYYSDNNENVTVRGKTLFHYEDKLWVKPSIVDTNAVAIYNIELSPTVTTGKALFKSLGAKYISFKSTDSDLSGTYYQMFQNCQELKYLDYKLPTDGVDYAYTFSGCQNLEHTNYNIELPNANSVQYMFEYNLQLGKNGERVSFKAPQWGVNASGLFEGCGQLKFVDTIELGYWMSANRLFFGCDQLVSIGALLITNPEEQVNLSLAFSYCYSLEQCPNINGLVSGISFDNCYKLRSIPLIRLYASGNYNINFNGCESLMDVGGFDGFSYYALYLDNSPLLTRDSCINIFNYAATVTTSKSIILHHEAYARLTEEDIAIAVNKGWTVQSV